MNTNAVVNVDTNVHADVIVYGNTGVDLNAYVYAYMYANIDVPVALCANFDVGCVWGCEC